ncbi:NPL4 family-domain-containing protein, partial [Paraphysoderma sedebokerense]
RHGDMVFVQYAATEVPAPTDNMDGVAYGSMNVKEHPVDDFLEKQDGLIKRSRDPKFCRHNQMSMCEYCMPLEPYDATYLATNKIKHMSFHAYLRQVKTQNKTSVSNNKFIPPLEEPDFKTFRMVDHVEFDTPELIESFLKFWRSSGLQRFAYLYGKYESYSEVPLGVKAVVSAIYEPPQEGASDGIDVAYAKKELEMVNEVANACGLEMVGMMFSDLIDDGTGRGKVQCRRHAESFFLSSLEIVLAGNMQQQFPTNTRYSTSGKFGSRFVTCIVSGEYQSSDVDIASYQVSNTGVGMIDANIVEPSIDPSVMIVKDSTPELYVPDVFYKYKNEYNVEVKGSAKPTFPVDYLIVNVTHGFPSSPNPLFRSHTFPLPNRDGVESQSHSSLYRSLFGASSAGSNLTNSVSDWGLLLMVKKLGVLDSETFNLLCRVATTPNNDKSLDSLIAKLTGTDSWRTMEMVLGESGQYSAGSASAVSGAKWACRHCTFENAAGSSDCEICGLPRG